MEVLEAKDQTFYMNFFCNLPLMRRTYDIELSIWTLKNLEKNREWKENFVLPLSKIESRKRILSYHSRKSRVEREMEAIKFSRSREKFLFLLSIFLSRARLLSMPDSSFLHLKSSLFVSSSCCCCLNSEAVPIKHVVFFLWSDCAVNIYKSPYEYGVSAAICIYLILRRKSISRFLKIDSTQNLTCHLPTSPLSTLF